MASHFASPKTSMQCKWTTLRTVIGGRPRSSHIDCPAHQKQHNYRPALNASAHYLDFCNTPSHKLRLYLAHSRSSSYLASQPSADIPAYFCKAQKIPVLDDASLETALTITAALAHGDIIPHTHPQTCYQTN